ncbi:hypothetical protein CDD82_7786 [Ophiocordyceps australis]|uniref:Leucine-rich repeat domain-containing protein n=1 Tax=Ophiocordyceps australis TaxID=1399860 RepID=A0A2C5YR54_9HYPO|nr:hypothetical protein CDD82_7786 [Ophiocordyceps australis]
MQTLCYGYEDGFLALLLMGCPNLDDFGIGQSIRPLMVRLVMWTAGRLHAVAHHLKKRDIEVPASIQPYLRALNLKSFYQELRAPEVDEMTDEVIAYWYNGFPCYQGHEDLAIPFFRMSNARRYECVLADGHDDGPVSLSNFIERGSSPVEHITLRRSRLTPGALTALVGSCKQLRSFEYIRGTCFSDIAHDAMPDHLMRAILPHKETLESLIVDFDDHIQREIWWEAYCEPEQFYLGYQFRQMKRLTKLVVGMQLVTGVTLAYNHTQNPNDGADHIVPFAVVDGAPALLSCLPPNLQDVTVCSCEAMAVPIFKQLIEAAQAGQHPRELRRLMILYNPPDGGFPDLATEQGRLAVSVMRQTDRTRNFDLSEVPLHDRLWTTTIPGQRPVLNLCSRIYSEVTRDEWIKWRYMGVGLAFIEEARVILPAVDVSPGRPNLISELEDFLDNCAASLEQDASPEQDSDEEMT